MLSRRDFFRGAWLREPAAKNDETVGGGYFASFGSCYALLAEIPLEELLETARAAGVATAGKTKLELAKELFSAAPGGRV